jgi:hypothetical protein
MELELKMNINENIEITAIKESLFKRIQEKDFDFCSELNNTLNKVKYWEFADDELTTPIPFFLELTQSRKAKKLDISFESRFDKPRIFSFGFLPNKKLIVKQTSDNFNILTQTFHYLENNNIDIYYFQHRKQTQNYQIISLATLRSLSSKIQVYVGVNSDLKNYHIIVYIYDNDKVLRAYETASTWNQQNEYEFFYVDNNISIIKKNNEIFWKSNK